MNINTKDEMKSENESNGGTRPELAPESGADSKFVTLASVVQYIAEECHKNPGESIVDICNEAFEMENIPLWAQWGCEGKSNRNIEVTRIPSND